ncbi:hypothetical protein [Streptomyces sp. ME19-01-6]|uniref:hypothetical protein n=1 Tax=Streptomyces sp. ME19-01-6 TaxID=3028686 RepID=UPI0029A897CA|nr:hypothetical protein [Streptomyces sp. ME19-01-6]MDX3224420.1 hypothetical protein [Streptomyces sp. ME19-01-6]
MALCATEVLANVHKHTDSGRGMFILTSTAHRWGAAPTPTGKDVWFECRSPRLAPSSASRPGPTRHDA